MTILIAVEPFLGYVVRIQQNLKIWCVPVAENMTLPAAKYW